VVDIYAIPMDDDVRIIVKRGGAQAPKQQRLRGYIYVPSHREGEKVEMVIALPLRWLKQFDRFQGPYPPDIWDEYPNSRWGKKEPKTWENEEPRFIPPNCLPAEPEGWRFKVVTAVPEEKVPRIVAAIRRAQQFLDDHKVVPARMVRVDIT